MDQTKSGTFEEVAGISPAEQPQAEAPEITALVCRAKTGDADAFAALVLRYEARIIRLGQQMGLSREDALDACQDSFIKVFKYIRRFETGRSFFKWLHRIAIHAIYDQRRRVRAVATESLDCLQEGQSIQVEPVPGDLQQLLESAQLAARVRESLDCLSRRERIVFVLRDLQEMSTEEIGAILGLSQITVRRHCSSARQKLRDRLCPRRT
jgi:RNA polymerase sigma-70 factor (ECF subfamily)